MLVALKYATIPPPLQQGVPLAIKTRQKIRKKNGGGPRLGRGAPSGIGGQGFPGRGGGGGARGVGPGVITHARDPADVSLGKSELFEGIMLTGGEIPFLGEAVDYVRGPPVLPKKIVGKSKFPVGKVVLPRGLPSRPITEDKPVPQKIIRPPSIEVSHPTQAVLPKLPPQRRPIPGTGTVGPLPPHLLPPKVVTVRPPVRQPVSCRPC